MTEPVTVLVVDRATATRERIGEWLEHERFEVLTCPGPGPDHRCVGLETGRCALSDVADVVLLELPQRSADAAALREFYESQGATVVGPPARIDRNEIVQVVRRGACMHVHPSNWRRTHPSE